MCNKDDWPYTPDCLRDFCDPDTLAALEAGSCERLGGPVTILDYNPPSKGFVRIESFNEKQRYVPFCRTLRDPDLVQGGDQACRQWDLRQADLTLQRYHETGDLYHVFHCHIGLIDMMHIVRIQGNPVAIIVSGQYISEDGTNRIVETVNQLGTGEYAHIQLDESARAQLLDSLPESSPPPTDIRERLEREADFIGRIVQAEFELKKRQWEEDFLDELRQVPLGPGKPSRDSLRAQVYHMLELITQFCHCAYAVFFGSHHEGDTVLAPVAQVRVPQEIAQNLPHFNWKKAGLPLGQNGTEQSSISRGSERVGQRGIRGDNSAYFGGASCIVPTSLGDRYMGALVLGPTAQDLDISRERRFLVEMAHIVGLFALTGLEVLHLERQRKHWRSTAMLLTHQLRTALTPIVSQTGIAKALVKKGGSIDIEQVSNLLERAETLAMRVAQRTKQTLDGHVLQVESEDLDWEVHPLPVLVANCASGFVDKARQNRIELIIDDHVEYLPDADVDVARMTIALANLLENAVKYSFPDSTIYVRAHYDTANKDTSATATIEVDNLGYQISLEDRERIFDQGTRGLIAAKLGHIAGSGLGLWEARAIAVAHGGTISVRCNPTSRHTPLGQAHHVVFAITIPLRQPK